jgi:hypothetical protein
VFTVNKGTGDIETKETFEDFQLHLELKYLLISRAKAVQRK